MDKKLLDLLEELKEMNIRLEQTLKKNQEKDIIIQKQLKANTKMLKEMFNEPEERTDDKENGQ